MLSPLAHSYQEIYIMACDGKFINPDYFSSSQAFSIIALVNNVHNTLEPPQLTKLLLLSPSLVNLSKMLVEITWRLFNVCKY